ncbi:hypothetical protein HCH_06094 [Hahella chejuensis KCTC 2396]|uniref:Uncharacterized protein n=1 Tax=Hahella chejuensis (strain KCTC 2396) TaxID=349521 RepID=Q2S9D2_HAHCH|nr:hypothetical protein HCH_06094 [Hahella chejuensis KCTC 2396]
MTFCKKCWIACLLAGGAFGLAGVLFISLPPQTDSLLNILKNIVG